MDRGAAGEMEIPHRESFLSAFLGHPAGSPFLGHPAGSVGRVSQTVLWHIHPRLGNGWHAKGA
jgi:hypothetical protein